MSIEKGLLIRRSKVQVLEEAQKVIKESLRIPFFILSHPKTPLHFGFFVLRFKSKIERGLTTVISV